MRLAIQSILDFWAGCVSTGTAGSFYISGKPGTGKTATLREVRGLMQKQDRSVRIPPSPPAPSRPSYLSPFSKAGCCLPSISFRPLFIPRVSIYSPFLLCYRFGICNSLKSRT